MARKPKTRPSFFKVLIKDYANKICVPPAFVHKYGKLLPENAKLRTSSGESWDVKFEEVEDEKYCFTRGWNKFVKDVKLELGEFVIFWFNVGKSTFDFSVYGISGCERQISAKSIPVEDSDDDEEESDGGVMNNQTRPYAVEDEGGNHGTQEYTSEEEHPHFKLLLKKHRLSRVFIRKEFAVAAGLMSKSTIMLQYPPNKQCWPVLLDHFPNVPYFRLDFCSGWSKFRQENGLKLGKSYLFEYIEDKNVIEVKPARWTKLAHSECF